MNPDKVWRGLWLTIAIGLAAATFGLNPPASRTMLRWSLSVADRQAQSISAGEVEQWMADPVRHKPLLLDVRTQEEFRVSHLPRAIFAPYPDPELSPYSGMSHDTPIVVYCSVGIRSGQAAVRLRQAGFTHVLNLDGGIFEWAAHGGRLEGESASPPRVHPFNAFWAFFLDAQFRPTTS